jgi:hypothetical protein
VTLREAQAAENHALAVLHFERRRVAELSADLAAAEAQLGITEDAYRDAANRVLDTPSTLMAENHALAVLHFERRRVAELSADLAAAEAQLGIAEDAYRDAANRVLKMARP